MNISTPNIYSILLVMAFLGLLQGNAYSQGIVSDYEYKEVVTDASHLYELTQGNVIILKNPTNGLISVSSSPFGFRYTPNPGFVGRDTTEILFRQSSPFQLRRYAVAYDVKPSVVVAANDYFAFKKDEIPTVLPVLINDVSSFGGLKIAQVAYSQYGDVQISADSSSIVFTPETGFVGNAGIVYTTCDALGSCDQAVVKILIHEDPLAEYLSWDLPVGEYKVQEVMLPKAGYILTNPPVHGIVSNNTISPLVFDYAPQVGSLQRDSFTFTHPDGKRVEFFIDPVDERKPNLHLKEDIAHASTLSDTLLIDLLANDHFSQVMNKNKLSISKPPQFGTVSLNKSTGIATYIPNSGFEGVDDFEYRYYVSSQAIDDRAAVRISVSDYRPTQTKYYLQGSQNTPFVIDYQAPIRDFDLANFSTPNFGSLVYYPGDTTLVLNGQTVSAYNMLVYYPAQDYFTEPGIAPDEFEFEYCVGAECNLVKVVMDVAQVLPNDPTPCIGNSCLWAGDANRDGLVDMRDLLAVGIGMGEDGVERPQATTNWKAQTAPYWEPESHALSLAYVDADGNQFISEADQDVVQTNYGKTTNVLPRINALVKDQLSYTVLTPPPYKPGDLVQIAIAYGTESDPVIDGYGFALNFNYNADVIVDSLTTVDFHSDSWLGYTSPLLNASRKVADGRLDIGLSRTDFRQVSGFGDVLTVNFIVEDDINGIRQGGGSTLRLTVQGGSGMNGSGQFSGLNDLVIELPITWNDETDAALPLTNDMLIAYPNPAEDYINLHINTVDASIQGIQIYDMNGRQVLQLAGNSSRRINLNVADLSVGLYFTRVQTDKGVVTKKIQVIR